MSTEPITPPRLVYDRKTVHLDVKNNSHASPPPLGDAHLSRINPDKNMRNNSYTQAVILNNANVADSPLVHAGHILNISWKSIRFLENIIQKTGVPRNILEIFQIAHCVMSDITWKYDENPFIRFFPLILLTDRQRYKTANRQTKQQTWNHKSGRSAEVTNKGLSKCISASSIMLRRISMQSTKYK